MATLEERFAFRLASNDLPVRNRALKRLRKWVEERSALENGFTEMELLKLWKGLYVCMWHSDKPLVQEELAENISRLVHTFRIPKRALQFVSAFFATISREWVSIDRLRLDKFYMLIRKMVFQMFQLLQQNSWEQGLVKQLSDLMSDGPFYWATHTSKGCLGLQLHVLEVFLPELLSVVGGGEEECPGAELVAPALTLFANTTDDSVIKCIERNIIQPLHEEKVTRKLHVCHGVLAGLLRDLAISRQTVGRNRKALYQMCKRFSELEEAGASPAQSPPQRKKKKTIKNSKISLLKKKRKELKSRRRLKSASKVQS